MENIFALTTEELQAIANNLTDKIETGLKEDGQEILCLPTHIVPKDHIEDCKVLALDWGGTNFRAAIVEFKNGQAKVIEDVKHRLDRIETLGFTQEKLLEKMAGYISELKQLDESVTKIGYCFSYAAAPRLNGDAILLHWSKGLDIPEMVGKPVGEPLVKYLNNHKDIKTTFTDVKVINDTVACLFAGLPEQTSEGKPFDSYIGLIVGTGTNMAGLIPLNKIEKLNNKGEGMIPVNLEAGNFNPPHLTVVDGLVDAMSNNKGNHQFEKAVAGGYLGEVFKTVFMDEKIKSDFDGQDLSDILNNQAGSKKEHFEVATYIYERSAKLVAASLAGLAKAVVKLNPEVKNIYAAVDGTVFWSNHYPELVEKELKALLPAGVTMTISEKEKMKEPNLIGSAVAAYS